MRKILKPWILFLAAILTACAVSDKQPSGPSTHFSQYDILLKQYPSRLLDSRTTDEECQVHNQPLLEDIVPVFYGDLEVASEEAEARKEYFPHAESQYHAGCIVTDHTRALVRYCPLCRASEFSWRTENIKK